ncbi:MAG: hypothetical protein WC785_06550 [Tatlockia sp.]|jgi:hypothetical protein
MLKYQSLERLAQEIVSHNDMGLRIMTLKVQFATKGISKKKFSTLTQGKVAQKNLVLLSIVGNPHCTGEYLTAMMARLLGDKKHFTTLLIADKVYWHNLKETPNPEPETVARHIQDALAEGEAYLRANLQYFLSAFDKKEQRAYYDELINLDSADEIISRINQLAREKGIPFEIKRWNDFIESSLYYKNNEAAIQPYYCADKDSELSKSLESQAVAFATRHAENNREKFDLLLAQSRSYLKDEYLALVLGGAEQNYNFVVYAGAPISFFDLLKKHFLVEQGKPSDNPYALQVPNARLLLNWLHTTFDKPKPKKNTFFSFEIPKNPKVYAAVEKVKKMYPTMETSETEKENAEIPNILVFAAMLSTMSATERRKIPLYLVCFNQCYDNPSDATDNTVEITLAPPSPIHKTPSA